MLFRNDGGNRNNALRLTLEGSKSNRSAIGTVVLARVGKLVKRYMVRSGSSYLSQSELPLTIGLGSAKAIDNLTVLWPSGLQSQFTKLPANQALTVREPDTMLRQRALAMPSPAHLVKAK